MTRNSSMRAEREQDEEEGGFSSPPCFMHEVRPEYLGYLSAREAAGRCKELAALEEELGREGVDPSLSGALEERLRSELRDCLLRIYPSAERDDLEAMQRRRQAQVQRTPRE